MENCCRFVKTSLQHDAEYNNWHTIIQRPCPCPCPKTEKVAVAA